MAIKLDKEVKEKILELAKELSEVLGALEVSNEFGDEDELYDAVCDYLDRNK